MTTWNDLHNQIRRDLTIDGRLVLSIANARAHGEVKAWAKVGLPRTWAACFAEAMTMVWLRAKTIRDNELALHMQAQLPAAEQLARSAELQAELYDRAIPPLPEQARIWRERAAHCRRSQFHLIAAE